MHAAEVGDRAVDQVTGLHLLREHQHRLSERCDVEADLRCERCLPDGGPGRQHDDAPRLEAAAQRSVEARDAGRDPSFGLAGGELLPVLEALRDQLSEGSRRT